MRGFFSSLLLLTLLLPKSYFDDAMPQGILRVKKGYYTTYTTLCLGRQTTTVPFPEKDVSPSIFFSGGKSCLVMWKECHSLCLHVLLCSVRRRASLAGLSNLLFERCEGCSSRMRQKSTISV